MDDLLSVTNEQDVGDKAQRQGALPFICTGETLEVCMTLQVCSASVLASHLQPVLPRGMS